MIDALLDDFFFRALIAGIIVAILAAPLGCFIVWRRMAYFGDTLAHAALLGVAGALALQINVTLAVFILAAAIAIIIMLSHKHATLSPDSLLGMLSHAGLSLGLILLGFMNNGSINLMGFLFGDILAVSHTDILIIALGGLCVLTILRLIWHPLIALTVSTDIAAAEGAKTEHARLIFMLLMALIIALSMKIVGVLLITSMLIMPAAAARNYAQSPEQMALYAAISGVISVIVGLYGSLYYDTPAGPSVVIAAFSVFLISLITRRH